MESGVYRCFQDAQTTSQPSTNSSPSKFDGTAGEFILQTDASAVGLGAVLEQDGHVIAYASRSLTAPERQ